MRTFNQRFKHILTFFLFAAIFSSYNNSVFAETSEEGKQSHEAHQGAKAREWPGIYNGFLPCADCIGLKMSLALNKRGSYVMITQYVGKSPRDFVEKGNYAWEEEDNTIVLTPRKKSAGKHYFLVSDNALIKLDDNRKRVAGKDAERYILRRNDVTDEPSSASAHGH